MSLLFLMQANLWWGQWLTQTGKLLAHRVLALDSCRRKVLVLCVWIAPNTKMNTTQHSSLLWVNCHPESLQLYLCRIACRSIWTMLLLLNPNSVVFDYRGLSFICIQHYWRYGRSFYWKSGYTRKTETFCYVKAFVVDLMQIALPDKHPSNTIRSVWVPKLRVSDPSSSARQWPQLYDSGCLKPCIATSHCVDTSWVMPPCRGTIAESAINFTHFLF